MLSIKGFQKICLVDFPPYTASTIFLGSCNFKCGFCHNPDLVLNFKDIPDIPEQEIFDYLKGKKQWIDGVCITGGEPTLHKELPEFIEKIKKLGMLVKLDTNGANPEMIKTLLQKKLLDFIAMDIKSSLERYDEAAGIEVNKDKIKESVEIIRNSGIDYEFRTTVLPGLVEKKEITQIGEWLKGSKKYTIQNFRTSKPLIDNKLQHITPYSNQELEELKKTAENYFDEVEIKN